MVFFCAIFGIALHYLSKAIGLPSVLLICIGAVILGFIIFMVVSAVGVTRPRLCSALIRGMAIGVLGVGSLIVLLGIEVTSRILILRDNTSSTEAVVMLAIAIVGLLAERLTTLAGVLSPSGLARITVHGLYGTRFPQRIEGESAEYKGAYQAIFDETTSDDEGEISGWSYSATSRRLALIACAVRRQDE
jgi:hypothetical protein